MKDVRAPDSQKPHQDADGRQLLSWGWLRDRVVHDEECPKTGKQALVLTVKMGGGGIRSIHNREIK